MRILPTWDRNITGIPCIEVFAPREGRDHITRGCKGSRSGFADISHTANVIDADRIGSGRLKIREHIGVARKSGDGLRSVRSGSLVLDGVTAAADGPVNRCLTGSDVGHNDRFDAVTGGTSTCTRCVLESNFRQVIFCRSGSRTRGAGTSSAIGSKSCKRSRFPVTRGGNIPVNNQVSSAVGVGVSEFHLQRSTRCIHGACVHRSQIGFLKGVQGSSISLLETKRKCTRPSFTSRRGEVERQFGDRSSAHIRQQVCGVQALRARPLCIRIHTIGRKLG